MSPLYLIQVCVTLILFCCILYFGLRFSRHVHHKKFSGDIKIIDRVPVDNGVSLLMVDIKGQTYLLGVTPKQVNLLEKLS